jgi:hypothetical protein
MADKTVTVKLSGGTYTTLALAIAGELVANANLVTMEGILTISIEGDWSGTPDTAAVNVDGFTTSAVYYVNIRTDTANRPTGKWDTTRYILQQADATVLQINDNYVRINGLQIACTTPTGNDRILIQVGNLANGANLICISNCILKGHAHATYNQRGIQIGGDYANANIWNCLVYNFGTIAGDYGIQLNAGGTVAEKIYSCTVIGGQYGIYHGAGIVTCKNCYAGGAGTADYQGSPTLTTCASEDNTGTAGLQEIIVNTTNFVNISAGTEDFRLPSGSGLIDVGTDTSGESSPLDFTDDIAGDIRDASWDIGADEYKAAGGGVDTAKKRMSATHLLVPSFPMAILPD